MTSQIKFVFHGGKDSAWYGTDIMLETIILISFYPDIVHTVEFLLDPNDSSTKSLGCEHLDVLDNIFYTSYLSKTKLPAYRKTLSRLVLSNIELNAKDRSTFAEILKHLTGLKELDLKINPGKITRWQLFLFSLQELKLMNFFKKISKNLGSQKFPENPTKALSPVQYLDALIRLPLEKFSLKNLDLHQTTAVCRLLKHLHPACKTLSLADIKFSTTSMKALAKNLGKTKIDTLDLSASNCTDEQALELARLIQQKNPQRTLHIHFGDRYFEARIGWPLSQLCREGGLSIDPAFVEQAVFPSTRRILGKTGPADNKHTLATPAADPNGIYFRLSFREIQRDAGMTYDPKTGEIIKDPSASNTLANKTPQRLVSSV